MQGLAGAGVLKAEDSGVERLTCKAKIAQDLAVNSARPPVNRVTEQRVVN